MGRSASHAEVDDAFDLLRELDVGGKVLGPDAGGSCVNLLARHQRCQGSAAYADG